LKQIADEASLNSLFFIEVVILTWLEKNPTHATTGLQSKRKYRIKLLAQRSYEGDKSKILYSFGFDFSAGPSSISTTSPVTCYIASIPTNPTDIPS
jgi:hypothetical protein